MSSTRIINILGYSCIGSIALYIALMAATMFFATVQTQRQSELRDTQTTISLLESKYYQSLDEVQKINPASFGLVTPTTVAYVRSDGSATALSRVGN